MQKEEGSSPFSRLSEREKGPRLRALYVLEVGVTGEQQEPRALGPLSVRFQPRRGSRS